MDPAAIINSGANTTSYRHPSEIWQFPPGDSTNGLGLRLPQFGLGFGDLAREYPNSNPVGSEKQRQSAAAVKLGRKRRDSEEESVKCVSTSNGGGSGSGNGVNNGCNGKRAKKSGNKNGETVAEHSSGKDVEPTSEPPKQDYIHVRARRGQATDSHSLAERLQGPYLYLAENFMDQSSARREKISERMKILQDLVPGCNKVIGKALVLDEIINYIQSLQRQVEFLSMKLETVNTRLTPGIEVFPPKDFDQQTFDTTVMPFASQATREYSRGSSPEWLHMQVGGGFERPT